MEASLDRESNFLSEESWRQPVILKRNEKT